MKTMDKLSEYNNEAKDLLQDYIEYYESDLNETIINKLDFTDNFHKFENILKFNETNFEKEVNKKINEITEEINNQLYEYNITLRKQIILSQNTPGCQYNNSFTLIDNISFF